MKNLLIHETRRDQYSATNYGQKLDESRGIGASTAQALSAIATAIANPTKRVVIKDHWGTAQADEYQLIRIKDIVSKLDLKFFNTGSDVDGKGRKYFFVVSNHVKV